MSERYPIQVVAIVPSPAESGDEVLAFRTPNGAMLPNGPFLSGERLLDAATRIVLDQAGVSAEAGRVVYLLETQGHALTVGVLCTLPLDDDDAVDLKGEFISLSRFELDLEPLALREILLEDIRSGFVRPVAHIVESPGENGPGIQVSW